MRVTGFEDAIMIKKFRSFFVMGEHCRCSFEAIIEPDRVSQYFNLAESRDKIQAVTTDGLNTLIMTGFVEEIEVNASPSETVLIVSAVSESALLDENKPERIFQSVEKTPKKVLESLPLEKYGLIFKNADTLEKKEEKIIMQNGVSDFRFIRKLAAAYGCPVWVSPDSEEIIVGVPDISYSFPENNDNYENSAMNIVKTKKKGNAFIGFTSMKYLKMGTKVTLNGESYYITEVSAYEKNNDTYFDYKAAEKLPEADNDVPFGELTFLHAEVTSNDDSENMGRIQVVFKNIEDNAPENERFWCPYASPYVGSENGGFVMLPDKGDEVAAVINNNYPVVLGSLRKNALREECQTPDNKIIFVRKASKLLFNEEKIEMLKGESTLVNLTDDDITVSEKDKSVIKMNGEFVKISQGEDTLINLTDNDITISEKNSSVMKLTDDSVKINAGDKSVTEIKKDAVTVQQDKTAAAFKDGEITVQRGKEAEIKLTDSNLTVKAKSETEIAAGKAKVSLSSGNVAVKGSKIDLNTGAGAG